MSTSGYLLAPWAKTERGNHDPQVYHPALFHMLDVGHVAQLLIGPRGPRRLRTALAATLGCDDAGELANWLPLVVALHDLGKISSPFQAQNPDQVTRLTALGLVVATAKEPQLRHQHFSMVAWSAQVIPLAPALAPLSAVVADALGGHHGTFAPDGTLKRVRDFNAARERPPWHGLREEAVRALLDVYPLDSDVAVPCPHNTSAATALLTGFTILADWLGSDTDHFELTPGMDLSEYLPLSRERAEAAVRAAEFVDMHTPAQRDWQGFSSIFPAIADPRPLQLAVDALPEAVVAAAGLFIIEAPTGEGKTEAALALARRLAATTGSDDLYFALPTMATSNQMFGRLERFLHATVGAQAAAKLIHGQALLVEDELRLAVTGDAADPESPAAAVPEWFAPRKRALLSPWGVGTIDQAELAVLSARHYMLRLLGLAGKVAIIDEVHAYDTYMSKIIDHLLTWLAAVGTPVILLSATLPVARHHELAAAYRRGLSLPSSRTPGDDSILPYPLFSAYGTGGAHLQPVDADRLERALSVRFVRNLSPEDEARRLIAAVRDGGALCRITNTVGRAQRIYRALRQLAALDPELELHLLHARMPGDQRLEREQEITARLGPDSHRTTAERIIVVGTQVLEQSLDLDFDFMVSDLAPVDLLLQRAGRLHRHPHRPRPDAFPTPVLEVIIDAGEDTLPNVKAFNSIYEPYIVWRTWLVLRERQPGNTSDIQLTLPADYRPLIEATYAPHVPHPTLGPEDSARLLAASNAATRHQVNQEDKAKQRLIPEPDPVMSITEGINLVFEEDEDGGIHGWGSAATRDGAESITVVPLHRVSGNITLDQHGGEPLPDVPDRALQLQMLRRSFRVSGPAIAAANPAQRPPDVRSWRAIPLLRNVRPLVFEDGCAAVYDRKGRATALRLDAELGLLIGKDADA